MVEAPPSPRPTWLRHYPDMVATPLSASMAERDNLGNALSDAAALHPNRVHIRFNRDVWTYEQTSAAATRLASALLGLGLTRGARVGLMLPNGPTYVIAAFALWRAGLVVVGMSPLQPDKALGQMAQDAGIERLLTADTAELIGKARKALGEGADARIIVCRADGHELREPAGARPLEAEVDGQITLRSLLASACGEVSHPAVTRDDLAVLGYTGGTTGEPKGVMLSHGNFLAAAEQMRRFYGDLRDGEERFLAAAPFTHMGGLQNTLNLPTSIAAEIVVVERFDAACVLDLVERVGLTFLLTVPTMLVALMRQEGFAQTDWRSVRTVVSGGAPLPYGTRRAFEAAVGATVRNGYGLTESTGVGAIMPGRPDSSATATGVPLPEVRVRIVEPATSIAVERAGAPGEILMAGPHIMSGYWRRPDATAETLHQGWLRTGDIGYLDEDGYLHVVDRLKDLIIASGYNVYPSRVEAEIAAHPAVTDVAVIGVPDAYRGETVKALVTLKPGANLTLACLTHFLSGRLSAVEQPKLLEVVEQLPQTAAGKVSRADARRMHGQPAPKS